MGKLLDFLSGVEVLAEATSVHNGKLEVVRDLAWGVHIKGGGLTQSGGVAGKVWKEVLSSVKKSGAEIKSCLILGLGGGSAAKLVGNLWKGAKIKGVDIDPVIVNLGNKYMGLDKIPNLEVFIEDSSQFLKKSSERYDLILIDMYKGDNVPMVFDGEDFIKRIRNGLNKEGVAIFNRLYFDEKKKLAVKLLQKLKKLFTKVTPFYPEANVMFICEK